jgi:hypothetical protein
MHRIIILITINKIDTITLLTPSLITNLATMLMRIKTIKMREKIKNKIIPQTSHRI